MGIEEAAMQLLKAEAFEQGIEKGIEKDKRDVVINAYRNGINVGMIANIVSLPLEKVQEIIDQYLNDSQQMGKV